MKKKVLLIHTGGTIGMVRNIQNGTLKPDQFYESILKFVPELEQIAHIEVEIPCLLDSAEIHIPHWQAIGRLIRRYQNQVQGVVITHGTDTLAYTASALSYMLMNVPFPVILTGAQKPLGELRTDARNNFVNAIEMATLDIPEVAIYFDYKLMRGNRTIKSHITHFDAFSSPNYPLLGEVGLDIVIYPQNMIKPQGLFHVFDAFDASIAVLKLFPGIDIRYFNPDDQVKAVLLIAWGAGTVPTAYTQLLPQIKKWLDAGKIVAMISETKAGCAAPQLYESGNRLLDMGVLSAGDMTFEAALTKLMFLMAQRDNYEEIKRNFMKSLAGERSV